MPCQHWLGAHIGEGEGRGSRTASSVLFFLISSEIDEKIESDMRNFVSNSLTLLPLSPLNGEEAAPLPAAQQHPACLFVLFVCLFKFW
jgi:hypothetical protein